MNINSNHFIQFMLKNPCVTLDEALNFYKTLTDDNSFSQTNLKQLISEINSKICQQSFQIVLTTCEVTNQPQILWLNTKNDSISKFQSNFTQIELEYFNLVMKDIIEAEQHKLTYPFCLNITSCLVGGSLSRNNGQEVLNRWIEGGYFVKVNGDVYLGMRTILEFTTYLQSLVPNSICGLCSELVFINETCSNCNKIYHNHCLNKYLSSHQTCPQCKNKWQDARQSQVTMNGSSNTTSDLSE